MSLKATGNPSDLISVSVPKDMARPGSHFRFALPAQALPLQAVMTVGDVRIPLVITERNQ